MDFLSHQFHYNKKASFSVSGSADGVGVFVSTDIRVDNIADSNVTDLTNNLISKNFSCVSDLEDQILLLKNSFQKKMLNVFLSRLSRSS